MEHLYHVTVQIAYRAVDEYCLDNAISVLKKSVLPHMSQTIALLDGSTGSQRALTTAGKCTILDMRQILPFIELFVQC